MESTSRERGSQRASAWWESLSCNHSCKKVENETKSEAKKASARHLKRGLYFGSSFASFAEQTLSFECSEFVLHFPQAASLRKTLFPHETATIDFSQGRKEKEREKIGSLQQHQDMFGKHSSERGGKEVFSLFPSTALFSLSPPNFHPTFSLPPLPQIFLRPVFLSRVSAISDKRSVDFRVRIVCTQHSLTNKPASGWGFRSAKLRPAERCDVRIESESCCSLCVRTIGTFATWSRVRRVTLKYEKKPKEA